MSPHVGYFPREYPKPLSIGPPGFVPQEDTYDWLIVGGTLKNRAVLTEQLFSCPILLPHGVTVTKLTLYGFRDDGLATLMVTLQRATTIGATEPMTSKTADWTTGDSSGESTAILNPVIDNNNYAYFLTLQLDPNDSVEDVKFRSIRIDWN